MDQVVWVEDLLYKQEKMFLNWKIDKIGNLENKMVFVMLQNMPCYENTCFNFSLSTSYRNFIGG